MATRSCLVNPGRCIRFAVAWSLCIAGVAAAAAAGFRGLTAWARPALTAEFVARRAALAQTLVGEVVGSVALSDGAGISQSFDALENGLCGLRLRVVTWHEIPDAYECSWSLAVEGLDGWLGAVVRHGTLAADEARDWEWLELAFEPLHDSRATRYTLVITGGAAQQNHPVGVPLHRPVSALQLPARPHHGGASEGPMPAIPPQSVLDLQPRYVDERG
jgi:hypothetical protein